MATLIAAAVINVFVWVVLACAARWQRAPDPGRVVQPEARVGVSSIPSEVGQ